MAPACANATATSAPVGLPPPATDGPAASATAGTAPGTSTIVGDAGSAPAVGPVTTAPAFAGTTIAPPTAPAFHPLTCPATPSKAPPSSTAPGDAASVAGAALTDPLAALNRAGTQVGVSVRVDGVGDVVMQNTQQLLVPASNQKLLVATAAFEALPLDDRLETSVVATGPTVDGEVRGDLVLVGGGDPGLTKTSAQSLDALDALVAQLHDRGITHVQGHLLVDDTRYDAVRVAPGWPDNAWNTSVGPLSALMVDRNRDAHDAGYLADPSLGNGQLFLDALTAAGITVAGPVTHGTATTGERVASQPSATIRELIGEMLTKSDNLIAETLVKELGVRFRGVGSTAAGLAAAREIVAGLCIAFDGNDADGSGLSHDDHHSAGALRSLLEVARTRPWWTTFRDALPLAGRSGTLALRLAGPATAGKVRAKTGSTLVSRALSGYATTAVGHQVVFSIVVNGPNATAETAIDAFVTAVAQLAV